MQLKSWSRVTKCSLSVSTTSNIDNLQLYFNPSLPTAASMPLLPHKSSHARISCDPMESSPAPSMKVSLVATSMMKPPVSYWDSMRGLCHSTQALTGRRSLVLSL